MENNIKRDVKTCLRYPGGKFYGAKKILPFCEVKHHTFIEPFVGGASIFLAKSLAAKLNWINDFDPELINFYSVIKNKKNREKLFELLRDEEAHPERHNKVNKMKPKNKIEKAFKYFYLNRTSFSGIMNKPRWGYRIGSSLTPDRWISRIVPVAEKLKNAKITNLDFKKMFSQIPDKEGVLLYLDPPYFKASKAIYCHEFSHQDHIDLKNLLMNLKKAKFILSYENCPEIKEIYNWAKIHKINFRYFMSEGRRQEGSEFIITNF